MIEKRFDYVIVGISPNLTDDAKGHFGSYHKRFFEIVLRKHNIRYLGCHTENTESSWYEPVLPPKLGRPRPYFEKNILRILEKGKSEKSHKQQILYIYEGSFFWLLTAAIYLKRNPMDFVVINLFDTRKIFHRLESSKFQSLWTLLYKTLVGRFSRRLLLTYDNEKYGTLLKRVFDKEIIKRVRLIPSFDTAALGKQESAQKTKTLVVIRGRMGADTLSRIASQIDDKSRLVIHGLSREAIDRMGLNDSGISEHLEDFGSYIDSYREIGKCVFLYDSKDFEYQSSGRLLDSLISGCCVSVPKNTALTSELGIGMGKAFYIHSHDSEIVEFINFPKAGFDIPVTFADYIEEFENDVHEILSSVSDAEDISSKSIRLEFINFLIILYNFYSFLTAEGRLNRSALRDYFIATFRKR